LKVCFVSRVFHDEVNAHYIASLYDCSEVFYLLFTFCDSFLIIKFPATKMLLNGFSLFN